MPILRLLRATLEEAVADRLWRHAAAVAYYALFTLGPFLVLVLLAAGRLVGPDAAHAALLAPLHRLLGPGGSRALDDLVAGTHAQGPGAWGIVLGGAGLLAGATGAFAQLKEAINAVWDVERKAEGSWAARLWRATRENLLSAGGVLSLVFLLVVSVALGVPFAGGLPSIVLGVGLATLGLALLFKLVPDAEVAWRDAWIGALATALLLGLGQGALALALALTPLTTAYGAMGAAMALILWVYVCALVTLLGAAFTQVWANRKGRKVRPAADAEPRAQALARRERPSG